MSRPKYHPHEPYNELPTLPPDVELDTKPVLRLCIAARAALAELKQSAEMIPNQSILINTLALMEAQASSEIENIVTTHDRLFQFHNDEDHADPATREALRYRHALMLGCHHRSSCPLSTQTAEVVCTKIKGVEMGVRRIPGTQLRTSTGEVIYTPPVGEELLRNLLANWERFLHDANDLDPLIRMAVGHYQFEAIHPFTDGNGRTGRVLNSLYLIEEGLLPIPILYLSRYIIQTRSDYYRLLLDVTINHAWEVWLSYILIAITETAAWTASVIKEMRKLIGHTSEYVRQERPKIYSHELINQIFMQPYCRIQNIVEADIVKRQAASRHLGGLAEIGVLEARKIGRDKLFIHPKLLRLLTEEPNTYEPYF